MKKHTLFVVLILLAAGLQQCSYSQSPLINKPRMDTKKKNNLVYSRNDSPKVGLSEAEWKKNLPADVYYISRQKGTERPGTSHFEHSKEVGTYYCAACGNALFQSDTKFDSGCGWPSFYQPIS